MEEAPRYDLGGEPRKETSAAFNKPTKGTSVEKFREMITDHLKVRKPNTKYCQIQFQSFSLDLNLI